MTTWYQFRAESMSLGDAYLGVERRHHSLKVVILLFTIALGCGGRLTQETVVLDRSSVIRERVSFDDASRPSVELSLSSTKLTLVIKQLAQWFRGVETTRTLVEDGGKPYKDIKTSWGAPLKSEQLPLKKKIVIVEIHGLREWTCETDDNGRCEIDFTEKELNFLFARDAVDLSIKIGEEYAPRDSVALTITEDYKSAKTTYLEKQEQERFDKLVAETTTGLEKATSLCTRRKAAPNLLKYEIYSAMKQLVRLDKIGDPPEEVDSKFDILKETCFRHAKRLVAEGHRFGTQKRFTEAIEYFRLVQVLWPDSRIANVNAQSGIETAQSFMEEFKPERIKDLVALPEGDGVTMYLGLVNRDELYTAVPGKIIYQIFLRNGGALVDKCYEKEAIVNEDHFKDVVVGLGAFQREMLVLRLPFLKWRSMRCNAVKTYLEMGGLAGLQKMPYTWDFSLQVLYVPDYGAKMEATDTFRP